MGGIGALVHPDYLVTYNRYEIFHPQQNILSLYFTMLTYDYPDYLVISLNFVLRGLLCV